MQNYCNKRYSLQLHTSLRYLFNLPPVRDYLRSAAWDHGSGGRSPRNYRFVQITLMLNEFYLR